MSGLTERQRIVNALRAAADRIESGGDIRRYAVNYDGPELDLSKDHALDWADPQHWLDCGEWHEGVEHCEWGVIVPIEKIQMTDRVETPDGPYDFQCNYELVDVTGKDPQ